MKSSQRKKKKRIWRNHIHSGGNIFWIGPDLYLFLLRIDRDVCEIWVMRDSLGWAIRAGCVLRKECRNGRQLSEIITEDMKADILEKANAWLAAGDERIVRDGEWFGIEY